MSIGIGPGIGVGIGGSGGGAPVPFTILTIEGDSLTSLTPGVDSGSYAWLYKSANPAKTVNVRAQGSRSLGTSANLDDDGNTLWGNRTEDLTTYDAEVYTVFIGANSNFNSTETAAAYWVKLKEYLATFRAAGKKIGLATLTPWDIRHGADYSTFNANIATYNALIRSNFAETADFIIPFGEMPVFYRADGGATNNPALSDGVHYFATTPALMQPVFTAAIDAMMSRSTATGPAGNSWFGADVTNAPTSTTLTYTYIVAGMAPGYAASVSIGAAAIAAGVRMQIGWSTNLTSGTVHNGDTIILSVPTSASVSTPVVTQFTIGSKTITFTVTTAASPPSVITYDPANKSTYITLSLGNRRLTSANTGALAKVRSTTAVTGKRYVEFTMTPGAAGKSRSIGIINAAYPVATEGGGGNANPGAATYPNSGFTSFGPTIYVNGAAVGLQGITTYADNDVVMLAIDTVAGKVWHGKNGTWATGNDPAAGTGGSTFTVPPAEYYFYGMATGATFVDVNCGQDAFVYTPPSGFSAWG